MAFLKNLNHLAALILEAFKSLGRGRAWLALLSYFVILAIVLVGFYKFLSPFSYGPVRLITLIIDSNLSDRFFHYPAHFLYLPWFFGWVKLALGVLLEGIFLGTAALFFWKGIVAPDRSDRPFRAALRLWPQFILLSIIFNGLVTLVSLVLPNLMTGYLEGSPRRQLMIELAILPAIYTFLLALFYLAIPSIAIYRQPFLRAIGTSLRHAARRPFTMLTLSALVLILPVLISAAANHPDIILDKFKPELVFWLLMAGLFIEVLSNFFWMSTAVRFLSDEVGERP